MFPIFPPDSEVRLISSALSQHQQLPQVWSDEGSKGRNTLLCPGVNTDIL